MNINDINKELLKIFLEKHGEVRLSKKHDFLAIERKRTDSHVIVGVSCQFFDDCHTTISQFEIPVKRLGRPQQVHCNERLRSSANCV